MAAAAVALGAALILTGCGAPAANTGGGDAPAASDPATQPSDSSSDGSTTDTDGVDGQNTIPAAFPKDDIPMIEGDVAYGTDLGTGWVVYLYRDDYLDAFDQAAQLLTDKGFTPGDAAGDATGKFQQFTSDKYIVNLSAQDDANSFGKVVCYQVVLNG